MLSGMDDIRICKIDPEQRRVWGWGYIAKTADGEPVVDWSGDVIDTDEAFAALEDAIYRFVRDSGEGDDMHETFGVSKLIEAVVMSPAKAEAMGLDPAVPSGVWLGFEFNDDPAGLEAWEKVKTGERRMMSIVGTGAKQAI